MPGESLPPFLFCVYINDLEQYISNNGFNYLKISNNLSCNNSKPINVLYADDTVMMADYKENL